MIAAMQRGGQPLAINWPLRWVPAHATTKRVLEEGLSGEVLEVHYDDGNRGPLYHGANKREREPTVEEKAASWFYSRARGGGSLLDYLGYGTTLGTGFLNGENPLEVMCLTDETPGLEVGQHGIPVARYARGLSKFETRWGTFTDPWPTSPSHAAVLCWWAPPARSAVGTTPPLCTCRPGPDPRALIWRWTRRNHRSAIRSSTSSTVSRPAEQSKARSARPSPASVSKSWTPPWQRPGKARPAAAGSLLGTVHPGWVTRSAAG